MCGNKDKNNNLKNIRNGNTSSPNYRQMRKGQRIYWPKYCAKNKTKIKKKAWKIDGITVMKSFENNTENKNDIYINSFCSQKIIAVLQKRKKFKSKVSENVNHIK